MFKKINYGFTKIIIEQIDKSEKYINFPYFCIGNKKILVNLHKEYNKLHKGDISIFSDKDLKFEANYVFKKPVSLKTAIKTVNKYKNFLQKGLCFVFLNKNTIYDKNIIYDFKYNPKRKFENYENYIENNNEINDINNLEIDEKLKKLLNMLKKLNFLITDLNYLKKDDPDYILINYNKFIRATKDNVFYTFKVYDNKTIIDYTYNNSNSINSNINLQDICLTEFINKYMPENMSLKLKLKLINKM